MTGGVDIRVTGLDPLVRALKGPQFKDVNRELRGEAKKIAGDVLLPLVVAAVQQSAAPQAAAMAATARVHSDRVPVVVVGKVNPRLTGWAHAGESAAQRKARRGSMAAGVLKGPLGGRRDTRAAENYYRVPRSESGGPLGQALAEGGPILAAGERAYLTAYLAVLARHGFHTEKGAA